MGGDFLFEIVEIVEIVEPTGRFGKEIHVVVI